ncbi:hypothetical protein PR202_ga05343 [Eleusine coracana subsp. coracana]|uniref:Uncharacterized protein n=1 Tax=Eleusine coracana subsp. coracana TaxID=191504 RepID=A0AAV5BU28_ELECO|nr:hypothetical protein PR202_ga04890 [Eleusine coracana subsp. coracana]GJM89180.1 hypothetical protein PR202_ga05343 [Eleusine coracana subsp. coracana]
MPSRLGMGMPTQGSRWSRPQAAGNSEPVPPPQAPAPPSPPRWVVLGALGARSCQPGHARWRPPRRTLERVEGPPACLPQNNHCGCGRREVDTFLGRLLAGWGSTLASLPRPPQSRLTA